MSGQPGPRARSSAFLMAAIVLVALNLRPAAAAVGPLVHRIRSDTGLSAAGAGLLVTLSVLCFGALAPLAPALARRFGSRVTIVGAVAALVLGLFARVVPGMAFLVRRDGRGRSRDRSRQRSAPGARQTRLPGAHRARHLIVLRGGSVTNTSRLSTMAQTIGYLVAAPAPLIIGALHDLTGSWTAALIALLALVALQLPPALAAGREGRVAPAPLASADGRAT